MSTRSVPVGTRKGARLKTYSLRREEQEDRAEKAQTVKKTKAGILGYLRKCRVQIESAIAENVNIEDLCEKIDSYEETWRKFVNIHDDLMEHYLDTEIERKRAELVYDEELNRKVEFDQLINREREMQNMKKYVSSGNRKKDKLQLQDGSSMVTVSKTSSRSRSKSSRSIFSRKENLALARLKIEQLKKRQELARQQAELTYVQEMMEAEMAAERAYVSYKHSVQEGEDEISSVGEARDILKMLGPVKNEKTSPGQLKIKQETVLPHESQRLENKTQIGPELKLSSKPLEAMVSQTQDLKWKPKSGLQGGTLIENSPHIKQEFQTQNNGASVFHEESKPVLGVNKVETGEKIVNTLSQIINTPKIEYMQFDGSPVDYVSFIRNFETCLEGSNDSRNLQFLIQHCRGKAREAIESCVNLPVAEGYQTAKKTLKENFGLPHIIARAHLKRLENLPPVKNGGGSALLEFVRHLEVADRTLQGMGLEYVSELNHMNTLRDLNKKLPMFLRAKWTERAGRIIEQGGRPKFAEFLAFVKDRAKLINNEFGEDLLSNSQKDRKKGDEKVRKVVGRVTTLATKIADKQSNQKNPQSTMSVKRNCVACAGQHGVWKCDKFKELSYSDRQKMALNSQLCFRCLSVGHFKEHRPKTNFKCQIEGCIKEHHTLLHPTFGEHTGRKNENGVNGPISAHPRTGENSATGSRAATQVQQAGQAGSGVTSASVTAATGAGNGRVCLGVIPVKVGLKGGDRVVETYALLDSGSEVTLCKEQLCDKIGVQGTRLSFELTGVTGSKMVEGHMVDLVIMSMDGHVCEELLNVRTVAQIPVPNSCIPKKEDTVGWQHLSDINLMKLSESDVSLIIGLRENPSLFLPLEYRAGCSGAPVAVRYSLGWTIMGPVGGKRTDQHCTVNLVRIDSKEFYESKLSEDNLKFAERECLKNEEKETELEIKEEIVQEQLERLWKTDFADSVVSSNVTTSVEDKRALKILEKSLKWVDGHFQVALPWRNDPPYLPNNRLMAERRATLLRKRLARNQGLLEKYNATMSDYIEKGHAERVPLGEPHQKDRPLWYLPHHPVTHPLKPEKVRVVFDCAAKFANTSLNQQLLSGPDLTSKLTGVLTRFRQEYIGVVADIEAMFHQVRVNPRDCDALRFLWWPDGDLSSELVEYRMVKHLFGATSSPSVANFCLKKTAEIDNEQDPEIEDVVNRNMYVDDLMKSTDTTANAVTLVDKLRRCLSKGGFRLTKWYSNDREVIASVPDSERAKTVVNLELEKLPTQSALGLRWNIEEDKFVWEVSERLANASQNNPVTRRGILSMVYSLFDPLGFIAPYTMKAKLLLQMLSRKKIGWDDALEENERDQWKRWLDDVKKLEAVKINRCFKPRGFGEVRDVQLHMFSDASRQGYSGVAYLRLEDVTGRVQCSFVLGKARLAPIREISIPRLELTAAVISVKLSRMIQDELDLTVNKVIYWTDSLSVLKCINNEKKRFHTFESNRLTIIHDGSKPSEWRYVNRENNPADDGSKGLKVDALIQNDRWLRGPKFLWESEECWPKMIEVPCLEDDDPEVRKENRIYTTTTSVSDVMERLIKYHSSWWKLKKAVSWLLRFKQLLKYKSLQKDSCSVNACEIEKTRPVLGVQEVLQAENEILCYVQAKEFPEALAGYSSVSAKKENERKTKRAMKKLGTSLKKLNPKVENRLLCAVGRLERAPVDDEMKHPVILPHKHHVTDLIIKEYHEKVGHMGQESVLASLRSKYWVVKGRSAVRRVLSKCLDCQKKKVKPAEQFMADLPKERVTPNDPPFTYVGVDYFGPMEVKQGRSRVKRYGCLFTCLTVRAVHIEIAHSLDVDSMINALRRFICIRGNPKEIRSDNGTNFTGAHKELKEALQEWNQGKISNFCAQKAIIWKFNPPSASHMGGVWERMVQTAKRVLKSLLKEQLVNDEVLSTVVAEAVNVVNSRPLTRNSDSVMDDEPLTPNHLLHLRPSQSLPPGVFCKDDRYCRRVWRQAQYLSSVFWRRWTREYLPTLMERRKWNNPKENVKVGDLVLLADENYRRGEWPLALVVEVIPGRDGLVRTVLAKTTSTVATRAGVAHDSPRGDLFVT